MKNTRAPKKPLSAQFVKSVKEPGKYFDGHGLFLKVSPNGLKYWVQRITIRSKRREIGIGPADLISLADARETALANKRLAFSGGDPIAAKKEGQDIPSFKDATQRVYDIHAPTWRNKKHAAQFLSTLETYAHPFIGDRNVRDVDTSDVLRVLTPIWTQKPETARRVKQRIGTIMKWAIAQGWRTDNPAEAISQALPKQAKTQVHRKSLEYKYVADCIEAVQGSQAVTSSKLAFEFLVLTAARSGEIRLATWDEMDLCGAPDIASATEVIWTIPASRMKAKKDHRVPLPRRAIEILRQASSHSDGSALVFPGSRKGRPLSDATLRKLVRELGFDVDIHGFRTSFRTWTQERTSAPREVAEAALAHTIQNKVEAAYARSELFDKRAQLLERWAAFLEQPTGEVVRIG